MLLEGNTWVARWYMHQSLGSPLELLLGYRLWADSQILRCANYGNRRRTVVFECAIFWQFSAVW